VIKTASALVFATFLSSPVNATQAALPDEVEDVLKSIEQGDLERLNRQAKKDYHFYIFDVEGKGSENLPLQELINEIAQGCTIQQEKWFVRIDQWYDEYYSFYVSCPGKPGLSGELKLYFDEGLVSHFIYQQPRLPVAPPPPPNFQRQKSNDG